MRLVFSYPGIMDHAQQAALALEEMGGLDSYVTSFGFKPDGRMARLLARTPGKLARRIRREIGRRSLLPELAPRVVSYPGWEIYRTLAAKLGAGPVRVDKIWDAGADAFDRTVARRHIPKADGVVAVEYTALESFRQAKREGKPCILHLPSLDSLAFEQLQWREREAWPELRRDTDVYFDAMFQRRYERRRAEIEMADLIIANSSLTARSHIEAGAHPEKVVVAPLAAPAPVESITHVPADGPLNVIWSGSFSLGKGAHYVLAAWRGFSPTDAKLRVYGAIAAPGRLIEQAPDGIEFMGSVPRSQMLDAYKEADVLLFPTLSDGFGMSVVEALSRGVPVIVTDQAGAADLVEHGRNGLIIKAGDAGAIRDALNWCLDNRARLSEMRPAALESARLRQWPHYRRDIVDLTKAGLRRAGFGPDLGWRA